VSECPVPYTCPIIDDGLADLHESIKTIEEAEKLIEDSTVLDLLDTAKWSIKNVIEGAIEEARDANSELRDWGEKMEEERDSYERDVSDLEGDMEDLESEISDLKYEITNLENELQKMER